MDATDELELGLGAGAELRDRVLHQRRVHRVVRLVRQIALALLGRQVRSGVFFGPRPLAVGERGADHEAGLDERVGFDAVEAVLEQLLAVRVLFELLGLREME